MFTKEKMYTVTTLKNPQNGELYAHPSTKKKRRHFVTKRLAHTISVQSVTASVGE